MIVLQSDYSVCMHCRRFFSMRNGDQANLQNEGCSCNDDRGQDEDDVKCA